MRLIRTGHRSHVQWIVLYFLMLMLPGFAHGNDTPPEIPEPVEFVETAELTLTNEDYLPPEGWTDDPLVMREVQQVFAAVQAHANARRDEVGEDEFARLVNRDKIQKPVDGLGRGEARSIRWTGSLLPASFTSELNTLSFT